VGDFIRSNLDINPKKIRFSDSHHFAHACSVFYPSGFTEATVVVIDGLGSEQQTHSIYKASIQNGMELIFEQKGTGIGALYSQVTKALGFDYGEEGKTMGLAPYGSTHGDQDEFIPSFQGVFDGLITDYSHQLSRSPDSNLRIKLRRCKNQEDIYDPYFTRVAYNLQKEAERCLLHIIKEATAITGINNVCLSGGVALNCVANNVVQSSSFVDELFIHPASGDTGIPLGLALHGASILSDNWTKLISDKNIIRMLRTPYSHDVKPLTSQITTAVKSILAKHQVNLKCFVAKDIAQMLSKGNIISFFQDGIEIGPRALGHRSFLADPRSSEMKEKMNLKIKHREGYRPFAPMILHEHFSEYFISETDNHPYMLQAPYCNKKAQAEAKSIVHVDKTARVQTVDSSNGRVYDVLKEFYNATGVPILINTSFNDNNEPIVFTILDAMCCFARTNADVLVINDTYLLRSEIKNIKDFSVNCEKKQKEVCDLYFEKSILNNTTITKKSNVKNLKNFIDYNLFLTDFYRESFIQKRLIDFLQERDLNRLLILDKYHYNVLISFKFFLMGNILDYFVNYKIVDDDLSALKFMDYDCDVLLYNISIYSYSTYTSHLFDNLENLKMFYRGSDKMAKPYKESLNITDDYKTIKVLMESYENNHDKTIDNFFQDLKKIR
jgi:carbamoyltransferase